MGLARFREVQGLGGFMVEGKVLGDLGFRVGFGAPPQNLIPLV